MPFLNVKSGFVRKLVIFCHGYGSHGEDLLSLGYSWASELPETAFLSPHAPLSLSGLSSSRAWFPLPDHSESTLNRGCQQAFKEINKIIDQARERFHLKDRDIALVGFSQGAMLALYAGLRRAEPLGAIIAYSGVLVDGEELEKNTLSKPPVLLVHGMQDNVVPVAGLFRTISGLNRINTGYQWHLFSELGHGISPGASILGVSWLKAVWQKEGLWQPPIPIPV